VAIAAVPEIRKSEDMGETSTVPLAGSAKAAAGGRPLHARACVGWYAAIERANARAAHARPMRRRVMKTILTPDPGEQYLNTASTTQANFPYSESSI
jgi:hypothetical protein